MKTIACIIPARLASTRFPKKILSMIHGNPMLQIIYEKALSYKRFSKVIIAIDSNETAKLVESFNANYIMTSTAHESGTSRLIEVVEKGAIDADIIVNWQADEPMVSHQMLDDLLQGIDGGGDIWTLKKDLSIEDHHDPNVVKVLTGKNNLALQFSRTYLPNAYQHVGLYCYTKEALLSFKNLQPSQLSTSQRLEQIQWQENSFQIFAYYTQQKAIGIDTPLDLQKLLAYI